ncbi:hypothetical protein MASR2M15_24720 [Anaerolineales bacterium]
MDLSLIALGIIIICNAILIGILMYMGSRSDHQDLTAANSAAVAAMRSHLPDTDIIVAPESAIVEIAEENATVDTLEPVETVENTH